MLSAHTQQPWLHCVLLIVLFIKLLSFRFGASVGAIHSLKVQNCGATAAFFDFDELCDAPLSSADFASLAHRFDVVFLNGVPQMSIHSRDNAR